MSYDEVFHLEPPFSAGVWGGQQHEVLGDRIRSSPQQRLRRSGARPVSPATLPETSVDDLVDCLVKCCKLNTASGPDYCRQVLEKFGGDINKATVWLIEHDAEDEEELSFEQTVY
jgi:hypothetical protein